MTDIAVTCPPGESFTLDWQISDGDLATDGGLRTSVLLSLFTDARAAADDVLPTDAPGPVPGRPDRRGWWGDPPDATDGSGDRYGSRLWLLERAPRTEQIRVLAEDYAREALQWLLDRNIAARIDVAADWRTHEGPGFDHLVMVVEITRRNGAQVSLTFDDLWTSTLAETGT